MKFQQIQKMKNKILPRSFFLLAMHAVCLLPAQIFRWQSSIDSVGKSGYTKMLLTPAISSKLKSDFSDLRIYDQDKTEVPYTWLKDEAKQGIDRFVGYEIINKDYSSNGHSSIIVRNSSGNPIDHLVLEVNNADAKRNMHLSGSYDQKKWFAVKDEYETVHFESVERGTRKTTSLLRFDFPLTDYPYYRFETENWHWWWNNYDMPVFVARAGYIEPTYIPEQCILLPNAMISQTEDTKHKQSLVSIRFPEKQYVDHIKLIINSKIASRKDYYRGAQLYNVFRNSKDSVISEDLIGSTILSSLNANELNLLGKGVTELSLKIKNDDNQPLHIDSVKALQIKCYVVADLEIDKKYFVKFGNDSIGAPVYDIEYFKHKIPANLSIVIPGAREELEIKKETLEKKEVKKSIFNNNLIIWIALIAVGLLLFIMIAKMLKEMK